MKRNFLTTLYIRFVGVFTLCLASTVVQAVPLTYELSSGILPQNSFGATSLLATFSADLGNNRILSDATSLVTNWTITDGNVTISTGSNDYALQFFSAATDGLGNLISFAFQVSHLTVNPVLAGDNYRMSLFGGQSQIDRGRVLYCRAGNCNTGQRLSAVSTNITSSRTIQPVAVVSEPSPLLLILFSLPLLILSLIKWSGPGYTVFVLSKTNAAAA